MNRVPSPALLWTAFAYTVFVVYGSLVPLDFRALPWQEAVARFRGMPWLALGIGARADWVANVLLFLPLTFLWLGVGWHRGSVGWRLTVSLVVFLAAVLLSAAIEFAQVFFPPRTVSLNDVAAESLGALLGICGWWLAGPRLLRWLEGWQHAHGPIQRSERWLAVWLAGLFLYHLLPLDLTLSPVELYHKFRQGRLNVIPFAGLPREPAAAVYELATDVALWVPVAWLLRRRGTSPARAVLYTLAAASLLEFLQLWVYSRVSDVTDLITAAAGGALGAALPSREKPALAPRLAGGLAVLWLGVLLALFWYPFDFRLEAGRLAQAAQDILRVPLALYYFGTEYRAATEVLHKVLFFLPLGFFLGSAMGGKRSALALGALVAAMVEGGQLFLPGKHPDLTDWMLETLGVAAGLAFSRENSPMASAPGGRFPVWAGLVGSWLALTLVIAMLARAGGVPYNVRELIAGESPLLSSAWLSLALFWGGGLPVAMMAVMAKSRHPLRLLGLALPLHGLVGYVLIRLAVPVEALYDILGSPTLGLAWEWELVGRFLGLAAAVSGACFGAALFVFPASRPLRWLGVALLPLLLALAYAVVVLAANTDNLTELLAHGARADAFVAVWLAGFVVCLAAYATARWWVARRPRWAPVFLAISAPLTWGALQFGLESVVVKYGRVFSAMQFLLSRDRSHYATGGELVLRFAVAWGLAVALCALVAWSVWRAWGERGERKIQRRKPRPGHRAEGGDARDVEVSS